MKNMVKKPLRLQKMGGGPPLVVPLPAAKYYWRRSLLFLLLQPPPLSTFVTALEDQPSHVVVLIFLECNHYSFKTFWHLRGRPYIT